MDKKKRRDIHGQRPGIGVRIPDVAGIRLKTRQSTESDRQKRTRKTKKEKYISFSCRLFFDFSFPAAVLDE